MKKTYIMMTVAVVVWLMVFFDCVNAKAHVNKERGEWTLIVIPDTQHYSQNRSNARLMHMQQAFDWIVNVRENLNVRMVQGLGDITEYNQSWQWNNAKGVWVKLERQVAFMPIRGNHDDPGAFNYHFPVRMFSGEKWYGDDSGTLENNYFTMDIGNEKYMFLHIQPYDPYSNKNWNPIGLNWAKAVLDKNKDRKVILATHDTWHSKTILNEVLTKHNNIVLSNSGHTCDREKHYLVTAPDGKISHNFVTDYQCDKKEVMLLRYYVFKPLEDKVDFFTYSPVTNRFEIDEDSQGSFKLIQKD